jgi:hypothetical protein
MPVSFGKSHGRRFIALALAVFLIAFCPTGCAPQAGGDAAYMRDAANELTDMLWNVNYQTFTPEKATAYAKKYYESIFLKEFLEDISNNAGVAAVKEEKLISRVLEIGEGEASEEQLGDTVYKKYMLNARVEIINYEPMYPDDSILEAGKTYDLVFTLYFGKEGDDLKLVAFAYEPQDGVFLPKRANNVKLNETQRAEIKTIAQNYCRVRYHFDYQTYNPASIFSFFKKNATEEFIEKEGLTEGYLKDFFRDIKTYRLQSSIAELKVLAVDENKSAINLPDGLQFYYIAAVQIRYQIDATADFFQQAQMQKSEVYEIREYLGFDLQDGKFVIAFTEYE